MKSWRRLIRFGIGFLLTVVSLNTSTQPVQETAVPPEIWRIYNEMLTPILAPVQETVEVQATAEEIAP